MSLMISVITPSFNSAHHLERAIESVMDQTYLRWEHIVVDGGSTDGTIEILHKYSHLRWVSEPDEGQVQAMHKGFAMANGDVIVYLNADDYFFKRAFAAAVRAFAPGVMMVVGQIRVNVEKDGSSWVNDPRIDIESMLRHWEINAYCYNPVGYFIRRELQEHIPFNAENAAKHDLEFLLESVSRFPDAIVKVDKLFGVFNLSETSKTSREQAEPDYWRPDKFRFVERVLSHASPEFQKIFPSLRECGYQIQTRWAIHDAIRQGRAGEWIRNGRLLSLPVDGAQANGHMVFAEKLNHILEGGTVVCVLSVSGEEGKPLAQGLRTLPDQVSGYPVYHVSLTALARPMDFFLHGGQSLQEYVSCAAFSQAWKRYRDRLHWKFILLWPEPMALALSAESSGGTGDRSLEQSIKIGWDRVEDNLTRFFSHLTAINLLETEIRVREGFAMALAGNAEALFLSDIGSPETTRRAFLEFLGISLPEDFYDPDIGLPAALGWRDKDMLSRIEDPLAGLKVLDEVHGSPLVKRFKTSRTIAVARARWLNADLVDAAIAAVPSIGLAPYQMDFVIKILQHTGVAGNRILEIGSDKELVVGKALIRLGAAHMQCSNMVDFSDAMKDCDDDCMSFVHCDGRELPFEDASFDLVVGCALLEHVTGMEAFARELYRVVVPGGHVFLHGAPMWPSRAGHHVYFIGRERFYKFTDESNPVPDYGHLIMNPEQLADHVARLDIPQEDKDRIVDYVYKDDVLNRLHPDYIVSVFRELFDVVEDFRSPDTPFSAEVLMRIFDPTIAAGNEIYTLEMFLKKPD